MGKRRRKMKKLTSFAELQEVAVDQKFFDKPLKLKELDNPPNYARFEEEKPEETASKAGFFWKFW